MCSETTSALSEMGVINSDQIIGYSLVEVDLETDVIRINYKRPRNSFLPRRRIYEFKRIGKPKRGISPGNENPIRYEISPLLRRAIDELDVLLAGRANKKVCKDQIQAEIKELQREMETRFAHITSLLNELNVD